MEPVKLCFLQKFHEFKMTSYCIRFLTFTIVFMNVSLIQIVEYLSFICTAHSFKVTSNKYMIVEVEIISI